MWRDRGRPRGIAESANAGPAKRALTPPPSSRRRGRMAAAAAGRATEGRVPLPAAAAETSGAGPAGSALAPPPPNCGGDGSRARAVSAASTASHPDAPRLDWGELYMFSIDIREGGDHRFRAYDYNKLPLTEPLHAISFVTWALLTQQQYKTHIPYCLMVHHMESVGLGPTIYSVTESIAARWPDGPDH